MDRFILVIKGRGSRARVQELAPYHVLGDAQEQKTYEGFDGCAA